MAKIRIDQLGRSLTDKLAPLYWVSGDEPLLVQEACDSIRLAARQQGFTERDLHHVDQSFDWGQLLSAANSLSLFANQKLIELRLPTGKPGDKGSRALVEYCTNLPDDTLLLVVTGKLDATATRSKWYKAIDGAGIHLPIWPIDPPQLPRWIGQRLKQAGLNADNSAIEMLASRIEGNLLAAAQEIEKLKLLTTDGYVSAELMASVVADSARYDIFGLADKALLGDARAAVKSLHGLKTEGTEAPAILWALTRDLRQMLQASIQIEQGKHPDWAMKQAGIWAKRQALVGGALKRLKRAKLELLLRQAGGIDRAIKGMRDASAWDDLLDLVINIAGAQSLSPINIRLNLKL
ncbi:DNA polymerase III subunit delta [Gilvimarinus agarilyticus]|uniref:DNA polymerase III subunit delta n=1 Tax=unclassified Gilvimarinus TaxID=2642066 RepID=UPI001C09791C|nr:MULTISPECIES: DNA polymerase III subunit delta [unclassified Gilvimarinus]MBU2886018.1 DNA polymerase III subunit delta [Gilvimarinus agarilyticus]MDO6570764.1 DNA polymerase III subunit delta [Gilvimarinus sp. 2_MG-2023]MDO6747643.1 DNA polymerase III subunit delta [Gilvimarinus sp. 1_MG-2023]